MSLGFCFIAFLFGVTMIKRIDKNGKLSFISLSWGELLDDYRLTLEALNRSPKTISWYLEILNRFFNFLESSNLLKLMPELGSSELTAYILYLQNSKRWPNRKHNGKDLGKLSPFAVQGHVRAIKAFWSWLAREEHIGKNPLAKFPLPKIPQYVMPTLSKEQINRLLNAIDRNTVLGAKYHCILILLLDTGMRISELVNIKLNDLDIAHGWVTVFGKGQKQRICPFFRSTRKELIRYINNFRNQISNAVSPYLFTTADGDHISINSVQQYMRRLEKNAGLDGIRISPHKFRHTFATRAFQNEANLLTVKEIMGHRSAQTTMKYTHPQPEDLKKQHNRFSPVANQMGNKP